MARKKTSKKKDYSKVSKLTLFSVAVIGIVSVLGIGALYYFNNSLSDQTNEFGEVLGIDEEKQMPWWNDVFRYSAQLTVVNQDSFIPLEQDTTVSFSIDHKALVDAGKSRSDGSDLVINFYDETTTDYDTIPYEIRNPNTEDTEIIFTLIRTISPLSDDKYCLYYGNSNTTDTTDYSSPLAIEILPTTPYRINSGVETNHPLFSSIDRAWILKSSESHQEYSQLTYSIQERDGYELVDNPQYEIAELSSTDEMLTNRYGGYMYEFDASDLAPGTYTIRAHGTTTQGTIIESPIEKFTVSHPMYVIWTLDWEGVDTSDETLAQIDEFTEAYNTPIVHFWNPRAHLVLGETRLNHLLDWIKLREVETDEIGLHLHMFYDMLRAAGVTPQMDPQWANRGTGSDVPMYVYNYDETVAMLEWSKEEFAKVGLETPKTFRAGGWMLDEENLQALDSQGFVLDSSGRTAFSLGEYMVSEVENAQTPTPNPSSYPGGEEVISISDEAPEIPTETFRPPTPEEITLYENYIQNRNYLEENILPDGTIPELPNFVSYEVKGFWTLGSTTQPYRMSISDINETNSGTADIWEFPNNGGESWRFSTNELLQRFRENYTNEGILEATTTLTYLSHPHAVNVDLEKLTVVYDEMSNYKIEDDAGPILFTTFDEIFPSITGGTY
ncbi:hypothetical protein KC717_00615 [Candidatus Dojkabacteria bacterium]|uniref:DUF2341 domain-containing protein n=1 Tax=Candidatus Dojkabacteria bacterium TaxID=2099670 RepID=A0A955L711_9BACT|nr:hypothetical protein [Candidatus Dojkabacteria bacterium]